MSFRDRKKKTEVASVVTDLQARTRQAQELAAIPRQDLLSDPRLNPATRATADRLQAERLGTHLELEHKRFLRKEREADRRAEEAIRAAQAVDAARAATDPAYTVLDITRSRTKYSRGCLGASFALSVGSAMSLEAAVVSHYPAAADGIGYIAEIALTGLSTAAILWAGKMARAGTLPNRGPLRNTLLGLMVGPLMISMVGATIGSGPVGAIASAGAAAFSVLAYLVAVTSSAAIAKLVGDIDHHRDTTTATEVPADIEDQEHEEERPAPSPLPRRSDLDRDALTVIGEALAEEAEGYLRNEPPGRDDDGEGNTDNLVIPRGDDGSTSVIPQGTREGDDEPEAAPPALESAAQRRAREARERVRSFYYQHPGVPVKTAAKALGMDPKTVRKYHPGHADGGAS